MLLNRTFVTQACELERHAQRRKDIPRFGWDDAGSRIASCATREEAVAKQVIARYID